jgi:hypothetical protein
LKYIINITINKITRNIKFIKNSILKTPIKGGALNEPSKANIMVGTITASVPTNVVSKTVGGELLNSIAKLRFGKGVKRNEESNIRFIF